MIAFAISQTSTFRGWLKETVVEQVNSSTNGNLFLESIDGTIFTSLILNNTVYTIENDTLFKAEKIEIKTSPLKIFLKLIYFRKIEITNAQIALLKDENGKLNISKISKSPGEEIVAGDTSTASSDFNWSIEVADLSLKNLDFIVQSNENINSSAVYDHPDFDDFRLSAVDLSLNAFADFADKEYQVRIFNLSGKPNLSNFKLNNLSGNFLIVDDQAAVTDLYIDTEKSNLSINAGIKDYTLIGNSKENKIETAPLRLELAATDFDFGDLTTFVDATEILKGPVTTHLKAMGTLTDLNLEELKVAFGNTKLLANGRLQNIMRGDRMMIDTRFDELTVSQEDVNNLLHTIDIPVFDGLGILNFDTLYYSGNPVDFNSGFNLQTEQGSITVLASMDVSKEEMEYDYRLTTKNFNLQSVTGFTSELNSIISVSGSGTSLPDLSANVEIEAQNSVLDGNYFSELNLELEAENGKLNSEIEFNSDKTNGILSATLDATNPEVPSYNFNITIDELDLSRIVKNDATTSDLSFSITGEGDNFDQDELNLFAVLDIDNSSINGFAIDSTRIIVDIISDDEERVVNVVSDLADITLTGNYTIQEVADLFIKESGLISQSIENKISEIHELSNYYPRTGSDNTQETEPFVLNDTLQQKHLHIDYLLEFKNFELLSLLLGDVEIEVDGEISGEITSLHDLFTLSLNSRIDYFKYWDDTNLYYCSQLDLDVLFANKIYDHSLEDFSAAIDLKARRIFTGSEIEKVLFRFDIKDELAAFNLKASYEDASRTNLSGTIDIQNEELAVLLDTLILVHNNYDLVNRDYVELSYRNDEIQFKNFELAHGDGTISLNGLFSTRGKEDLTLRINNLEGKDFSTNILVLPAGKTVDAILNLNANYKGTASEPVLNLNFSLDNLSYGNQNLGSFQSLIEYESQLLSADLSFTDQNLETDDPKLKLTGNIPVSLSLSGDQVLLYDKELDAQINADGFDLRTIGNAIPLISNLNGTMEADVKIGGTFENISSTGNIIINDGEFVLDPNNLKYTIGMNLSLDDDEIKIEKFSLANSANTLGGGNLSASGYFVHKNFEPKEVDLKLNGDIKLLSKDSRAADPTIYGDIAIRTVGDLTYLLNENQNSLNAHLILKRGASLTFSPTQSAFTNESDKFIYVFTDMSEVDISEKEIDSLILISGSKREELVPSARLPVDINVKIEVEDEAKMVFVLSREFNQKLTTYLDGEIEYIIENEEPIARGELKLLDGSKLDFIKSFQAEGSVKFLGEIDNPLMDVTATYQSYYNPDTLNTGLSEYEVQVRIKLEGPAQNLTSNFIRDEENINVYRRQSDRAQFELDPTKSASEAMFFIIVGKFPEDATIQESNLAVSTATTLAGSIVGSFLNEQLGDIVRSVQVQQVGTETRVSLIGKADIFDLPVRYEIGGTSQVFQDLARATVKLEASPFKSLLSLILRLERREPIFESSTFSEMVSEFGIKYSFEF